MQSIQPSQQQQQQQQNQQLHQQSVQMQVPMSLQSNQPVVTGLYEANILDVAQSPPNYPYSRTSSTGSLHGIPPGQASSASSAHNSDEEDDSDTRSTLSYKERRKEAHTQAEQRRRDAIKKGYEDLLDLIPSTSQDTIGAQKLSKAAILQKSIDYIRFLVSQKQKQEDELDSLRKEVMALKIMKANYEHIVKAHQSTTVPGQQQVPDEIKFEVFQQTMDRLFVSFNSSISVSNFAELSGCVFSWLEDSCKPMALREIVLSVLRQVNAQLGRTDIQLY